MLPEGRTGTIRFRTETGSLYEINFDEKTWSRLEQPRTEGPFPLRTKTGPLLDIIPENPEVGRSMIFIGPPFVEGADLRYVETSLVVEVLCDSGSL